MRVIDLPNGRDELTLLGPSHVALWWLSCGVVVVGRAADYS